MSLRKLTYDVGVMLGALRVPYNITNIIKNRTTQYIIEDFGVVVSVINTGDYGLVDEQLDLLLKGYRKVFVAESDSIEKKRYEVIWALMRSGYIKWIRTSFPRQFLQVLEAGNLGNLIIDERLFIWDNKPMYKYLIQDNLEAKQVGFRRMTTEDPSFFDYMP